jgi:Tfp pilus assembly pilus retraction ATPase PilT
MNELALNQDRGSADEVGMDLNTLLRTAVERGASDVHLKMGQPPIIRHDGSLGPLEG